MNYKRKKVYPERSRRAFTLIESLTVVFLSVVIVFSAYSIYLMSTKAYKKNSESAELTQNARIALERMSRDIRQSAEFVTVLPSTPTEFEPPSEIKFQDGHNLGPGLLPTEGKIQYITYKLVGTDLRRIISHYTFSDPDIWVLWSAVEGANFPTETITEDVVKAENVSLLQFWGNDLITMHLQVANNNNTYTFETKTLGRNVQ